jgi:SpoVK/Ycf46/Vps4 family AAA+-type ATPase
MFSLDTSYGAEADSSILVPSIRQYQARYLHVCIFFAICCVHTEENYVPLFDLVEEKDTKKWKCVLDLLLMLQEIAERMIDCSGADIECVCREAGLAALHDRLLATSLQLTPCSTINAHNFEEAIASNFP